MKIKLTTVIKQSCGIKPMINSDNNQDLTLKNVCINAILSPGDKEEEALSAAAKAKLKYSDYELYKKLRDVKEVDLKSEEIVRIKKKISNIYLALVLGQAYDLLEGKKE